ncbi:MAG: winged helix-turn-helix domain-containing protein [Pseudomonadota bacterium]
MTTFHFDDLSLDTARRTLSRGDQSIDIGGLSYDLLSTLVEAAPNAVDQTELAEAVWHNRVVTPETLSQRVRLVRSALGDDADAPRYIRTIRGFGYQLIPEISRIQDPLPLVESLEFGHSQGRDMQSAAQRHAVAVLPFGVVEPSPSRQTLAIGLHRDLINALARTRAFPVTAGASTLRFDPKADARDVAQQLGVRFLIYSNLREDQTHTTIDLSLVDGTNANVLWRDEVRERRDDLQALMNQIVGAITAQLESEVLQIAKREAVLPSARLDAWTAYHRGCWHMYWFSSESLDSAERWFNVARTLDPGAARPWACLSWVHWQRVFLGLTDDPGRSIELVRSFANESLARDQHDPLSHWALGRALLLERELDSAATVLARAVELNPSFAVGHYSVGFAELQRGELQASEQHSVEAAALSPYDPLLSLMLTTRAFSRTLAGDCETGAAHMREALHQPNIHFAIRAKAVVSFALAGCLDEARTQYSLVHEARPGFDADDFIRTFQYKHATHLTQFRNAFAALN